MAEKKDQTLKKVNENRISLMEMHETVKMHLICVSDHWENSIADELAPLVAERTHVKLSPILLREFREF